MARLTRLPLAMAVFSALMTSQAHALGLGEITLHSALNQPLDAEIELLQVGDLSSDELVAHLADLATFERMGIDRSMFLQNLRFTPVVRNGRGYIRVVSTQPIHEPYLNFLLELERPNGRLQREYTVLIDPPGYSSGSYAQRSSASSSFADSQAATPRPAKRAAAPRPAQPPAAPIAAGEGRYTTASGDTLWSIAGRLGAKGTSRHELMGQLQQLNPQAFVAGNPHRLRIGQTLVLPAGQAAPAGNVAAAPSTVPTPANGASPAATPAVSEATVALAENQLADLTAERERLNQRMDNLQTQLQTLQQALESRDQQVQSLQEQLAQRQAAQVPAAVVPAAPVAPVAPAAQASQPAVPAPVAAPSVASVDEADASPTRLWPWAAAAVAALLLLGLVYSRRKPKAEEPPRVQPQAASLPPQAPPVRPAPVLKPQVVATPAPQPSANEASLARLPAASSDSLEGANIYIAYGRFGQARDMLVKSIAAEPQRRELRMKLLLVLAELGDQAAFHEQEKALQGMGADQKQIDQLKARYPAMLEPSADEAISDSLGEWDGLELGDATETPAAQAQGEEGELNLGDLSLDLDWSSLDPFEAPKGAAKAAPDESEELLRDFRSNLRELPEVTEFDLDGEHAGAFGLPTRESTSEKDELLVSLDQARACIDRGDLDQAYAILKRVLQVGDSREREEARELLARIA